jgi:N-acetylmuramoyl-L-alanine amidase
MPAVMSSPNFDERRCKIEYIILHYTGMASHQEALEWLCDPRSKVSAHYFIGLDGSVHELVTPDKRAWHAGVSCWKGQTDMNSASIGIELANPGHEHGYHLFPNAQITALIRLCHDLIKTYPAIHSHNILAHSDIAPHRKQDPGELFPWDQLAQQGLGLWIHEKDEVFSGPSLPACREECKTMFIHCLREIGYCLPDQEWTSQELAPWITAFQRHFKPENIDGELTESIIEKAFILSRQILL